MAIRKRHLERKPTAGNDSFQHECHCFYTMRNFLQRSSLLNVSGEKGNGAGNYDGESEPNDTFKWPAKTILFAHGDQA